MADDVNKRTVRDVSDAEDAAIKAAIEGDPDTWEAPAERPAAAVGRRKPGRPAGRTKAQVTVSLDLDVLEALRTPEAKGWQTRMNATLRGALDLDRR